jgi:hypothetical protein
MGWQVRRADPGYPDTLRRANGASCSIAKNCCAPVDGHPRAELVDTTRKERWSVAHLLGLRRQELWRARRRRRPPESAIPRRVVPAFFTACSLGDSPSTVQWWSAPRRRRRPRAPSRAAVVQANFAQPGTAAAVLDQFNPNFIFQLAGVANASTESGLVLPTFHSHVTSAMHLGMVAASRPSGVVAAPRRMSRGAGRGDPASPLAAAKRAVRKFLRSHGHGRFRVASF